MKGKAGETIAGEEALWLKVAFKIECSGSYIA